MGPKLFVLFAAALMSTTSTWGADDHSTELAGDLARQVRRSERIALERARIQYETADELEQLVRGQRNFARAGTAVAAAGVAASLAAGAAAAGVGAVTGAWTGKAMAMSRMVLQAPLCSETNGQLLLLFAATARVAALVGAGTAEVVAAKHDLSPQAFHSELSAETSAIHAEIDRHFETDAEISEGMQVSMGWSNVHKLERRTEAARAHGDAYLAEAKILRATYSKLLNP